MDYNKHKLKLVAEHLAACRRR